MLGRWGLLRYGRHVVLGLLLGRRRNAPVPRALAERGWWAMRCVSRACSVGHAWLARPGHGIASKAAYVGGCRQASRYRAMKGQSEAGER